MDYRSQRFSNDHDENWNDETSGAYRIPQKVSSTMFIFPDNMSHGSAFEAVTRL